MRILRSYQLLQKVPYSVQHIGRLERAGRFPRRIKLGTNSVGWVEEEVDAWLEERARQRGPLPQPPAATKARKKAVAGGTEAEALATGA